MWTSGVDVGDGWLGSRSSGKWESWGKKNPPEFTIQKLSNRCKIMELRSLLGRVLCQPNRKSIGQIGNLTQIQGEKKKLWDSSCPTHDGSQGRINNDLNYPSMLPLAGNFNWLSCSIHPLPVCFRSLKKKHSKCQKSKQLCGFWGGHLPGNWVTGLIYIRGDYNP